MRIFAITYRHTNNKIDWGRTVPVWFGCLAELVLGRSRAYKWRLLTGWR